jgi:hypothetical protein
MRQEGAIILGIGGDNSNWATGYFFEGAMTRGMPNAQAMETVQPTSWPLGTLARLNHDTVDRAVRFQKNSAVKSQEQSLNDGG